MTFVIDTGTTPERPFAATWGHIGKCEVIRSAVVDRLLPGASQAEIDALFVTIIIGELHDSRMLETVRMHMVQLWPIIAPLAETDPHGFDEIMMAYAELSTVLPANRSEAIERRKAAFKLAKSAAERGR